MIALWVFLILTAFNNLLLLSSLALSVRYKDGTEIKIGFWGFYYTLVHKDADGNDLKPPKKEKKAKKNKKKQAKEQEKKSAPQKEKEDRKKLLLDLVKAALPKLINLLRHLRLKKVNIALTVAEEDAAHTAVTYGNTCTAVYNLLAALQEGCKVQLSSVSVTPDFMGDESKYAVSFVAKLRLWFILSAALSILSQFLANTKKKNIKEKAVQ